MAGSGAPSAAGACTSEKPRGQRRQPQKAHEPDHVCHCRKDDRRGLIQVLAGRLLLAVSRNAGRHPLVVRRSYPGASMQVGR